MKRTIVLLGAALALLSTAAVAATTHARRSADPVTASISKAIVDTQAGKLQGFVHNGTYIYKGVPYAQADRFMPPRKVEPWQGVKPALVYGNVCPIQVERISGDEFHDAHRYWPKSEDCQNLNVWTPAIKDGKKRPVMVWMHGGVFSNGSSIELNSYDGENLSKKGDVVVVSMNHRLNVLGFLDLSAYGPQYANSGNVGMMDLVASLQWVRDNIAAFGGDPDNITIFGQSGGGGKVLALMSAPAAKGLFHKAIVQSGTAMGTMVQGQAASRYVADLTLKNLGIDPSDVGKIGAVPYDQLIAAGTKALTQATTELRSKGVLAKNAARWAPVVNGYIAVDWSEQYPALSKDVPLLIGSNLNEFNTIQSSSVLALETDNKRTWTPAHTKEMLARKWGPKADAVAAGFAKAYPDRKLSEAYFIDNQFRSETVKLADKKSTVGGAPLYNYLYAWESPVLDGIAGAWHTAEIPMVFDNVAVTETGSGGGKAAYAMADKMSSAWINFARTGNPATPKLPRWPAYTAANPATMILDTKSVAKPAFDKDLIAAIQ